MITKDILLTLTYLIGAGELALAIFFWVTHSKNEIRKVMALLAFSTGMWGIVNAVTSGTTSSYISYAFVFGTLMLTAVFHLALIFPYPIRRLDSLHAVALYLPWAFFSYAILFTKTVTESYPLVHNVGNTVGGPLFPLLNVVLAGLYLGALLILVSRIPKLDGLHKKNVILFSVALTLGGLPGLFFELFQPFITLPYNYLYGPIFSGIWLGIVTYIVKKE